MNPQQALPGQSGESPDSLHPVTLTDVALREPLKFDVFDDLGRLLLRAGC